MLCGGKRGFTMKILKRMNMGGKLLSILLAALFMVSVPVTDASAASMPTSGSLTIHKYALENMDNVGDPNNGNPAIDIPSDAEPLAGVEFTVWQIDPNAAVGMTPGVTTATQAWPHIVASTEQTGVTNAKGEVKFSSLPQGIYYVAETKNSGNTVSCDPFLVSVPMVNPDTKEWITDVHAYPKNQSLAIDKFVAAVGTTDYYEVKKNLPVEVGERFNWYVRTQLPRDINPIRAEYYVVSDTLSSYFEYQPGTVKVYIIPASDSDLKDFTVLSASDYTVNFDAATNTLTTGLTTAGITKVKNLVDSGDRYAVIEYGCIVNDTAPQGVALYSGAKLEYTRDTASARGVSYNGGSQTEAISLLSTGNNTGITTLANGNGTSNTVTATVAIQPEVHTGKIGITKLADGTKKLLPGAEFGLAKTKEDALAGNFVATGKTDNNGELTFSGLKYGLPGDKPNENSNNTTFWLVETKAPDGYKIMKDPVEITFNYQNDGTDKYYFARVNVYNVLLGKSGETRPQTGDTSNVYIYLGIMALSLAALIIILLQLRKKKSATDNKQV